MANGLITKNTDLKSLKYGSMPLGSDKPYVTKNIGDAPSSQIGSEISHRIDDVSRIAQMLVGRPGIKYLLHEAQLQQIGVGQRIKKAQQEGKSLVGAVLQQVGSTLLNTVKIAGSTLAQVPVNGTGTHFLKGFRTDTYLQPSGPGNISAFASFFGAGGVEGAPFALRGEVVPGEHKTELLGKYSGYDYDDYLNVPTGSDQAKLNAQAGTPIKVIPSGSTQTDTTVSPTTKGSLVKGISNKISTGSLSDSGNLGLQRSFSDTKENSYTGFTTEENIGSVLTLNPLPTGGTVPVNEILRNYESIKEANDAAIKDQTSQPNQNIGTEYSADQTYSDEQKNRKVDPENNSTRNVIKEKRVGLGDQGRTSKATVPYWTPASSLERDKVNMLDVGGRQDAAGKARDMAKFYFEIITPDGSKFLYFRAFIKSLDDGYNADWQARKYNGRAENFYTYGGFDRDINVSFTIAAATRNEMKPLYKKMVYLASATAPTYGTSGLMRGTLARLTVGSYLDQIPGVITSVKFTVDNNVPWEIAMGQPEGVETDVQVLPMVMECTISFKPIHDFAPQTGLYHYFTNSHEGVKFFQPGQKQ